MQVQYDKYFDERGQITVFLSLLFLVLMMSFLFIVEGVISYSASSLGEDAVKGAGESIMANYDRELFKNYHLFFLDPRQKDYIVTDGKEFINQYFSGNSFFDIYCDSLEVTGEKTAVDEDGLYLKHEIREWMKYREEKEIAKVLEDIIRNTKKNDGERKECQEEVDSAETDVKKEQDNGIHKSDRTNGRQSIRNASSVFFDIYDAKSLCDSLVEGGRKGISVQSAFSSEEEVQVKAIYTLKLSVPFFRPIRFQKNTAVKRRVFSGYVKHRRDYDAAGDNSIVYVAENGVVYHKNASCSHICLKITGNAAIQNIVHSSKYAACEKCIHKGSSLSAIFVTAYGDCYHSTLGCSGLKRTIKAVRLKDVGRLRPCSRCASGR